MRMQPKKAYAKSQYTNILTLDKFAGHIASHGSKYNRADIYAVLMQTVDCMREMLLEGKRIEMGDLGVFSISIQSRGAENLETFNPAIHIEQLNVNWTPRRPGSETYWRTPCSTSCPRAVPLESC